jgi:hypothetical protein
MLDGTLPMSIIGSHVSGGHRLFDSFIRNNLDLSTKPGGEVRSRFEEHSDSATADLRK